MSPARRNPWLWLVLLAQLAALTASCVPPARGDDDLEATPNRDPAVRERPVTAPGAANDLVVRAGPLEARHVLAGELVASDSISLTVPNANIHPLQIRWLIEDGAHVRAGDRIAEFDNSSLLTQLEDLESQIDQRETELEVAAAQAAANVAQAEFALLSAQVQLRKASIEAEIPEDLTSAVEYANLQLELDKAQLELRESERALANASDSAQADVDLKRISYERALRDHALVLRRIDLVEVKAPRDGLVILQENRQEDRVFQPGDSTHTGATFAQLPDLRSLRVDARLYDVDDGLAAVGMTADVVLDAFPGETLQGTVTRVEQLARQVSRRSRRRVFVVSVDVEGIDTAKALPGMSARVVLHRSVGTSGDVVLPRAALDLSEPPTVLTRGGTRHEVEILDCNASHCISPFGPEPGTELAPIEEAE